MQPVKKELNAEKAIRTIAMREGVTVEEVRAQMHLATLAGLCSKDPAVQARWKVVPCKGEVPTPEELVAYLAAHADTGMDPFQ